MSDSTEDLISKEILENWTLDDLEKASLSATYWKQITLQPVETAKNEDEKLQEQKLDEEIGKLIHESMDKAVNELMFGGHSLDTADMGLGPSIRSPLIYSSDLAALGTVYFMPVRREEETDEQYFGRCVKITGVSLPERL